jgi:putative FmdB family regulatory protein
MPPLYEYECLKCGKKTEKLSKVNEFPTIECGDCGGEGIKVTSLTATPQIAGGTPKFYPNMSTHKMARPAKK